MFPMETDLKRAEAKSIYHLFGGFYCEELEALWNRVITKRNTAEDEVMGLLKDLQLLLSSYFFD